MSDGGVGTPAFKRDSSEVQHLVSLKDESGNGTLSNTDILIQQTNTSSHSAPGATLHLISVMAKGEGAEQFPPGLLPSAKPVTRDEISKIAKVS